MSKLCLRCHEPISEKRLQAVPNAALCIVCQESNDISVPRESPVNMLRLGMMSTTHDGPGSPKRKLVLSTGGLQQAISGGCGF